MDFTVINREGWANMPNLLVATPSVEGGTFLVDHGNYHGKQTHQEIALGYVSDEEAMAIDDGMVAVALERIEAIKAKPGFYRVVDGVIGETTISLAGTKNTVTGGFKEFVELAPIQLLPVPGSNRAKRAGEAIMDILGDPTNRERWRQEEEDLRANEAAAREIAARGEILLDQA